MAVDVIARQGVDSLQPPQPLGILARVAIGLMYPFLLVPALGWWSAQGLTSRIQHNDDWTGALIHTLSVNVFAVILLASMVTNTAIVSARLRNRPRSYRRPTRLPLCLAILDLLEITWLIQIAISRGPIQGLEQLIDLAIAASSVAVFVFAVKTDPASRGFVKARRLAVHTRFAPDAWRRRRRRRVLIGTGIPVLLVLGGIAAFVIADTTEVRHVACDIDGVSQIGGATYETISTTNCGTFDVVTGSAAARRLNDTRTNPTIVSRGWSFDLPAEQLIVRVIK